MKRSILVCALVMLALVHGTTVRAQSVTVTPNQQTTTASAVSNPTGQNISQQNNFYDPGLNSFGPGVQCGGPYLASSLYRNDSSSPGINTSGNASVGGTVGFVLPINGTNKKCEEFVREILFQRQLDTCLSVLKQGFAFDPHGQYAQLAQRCSGLVYTGQPINSANPVSPPPAPTVITVPAVPSTGALPLPLRSDLGVAPQRPAAVVHLTPLCQKVTVTRKKRLIAEVKDPERRENAIETLHAACVSDAEILSKL